VKPRYPFKLGSKEAEFYLIMQVGGTLGVLNPENWILDNYIVGGFNFGVAPGFQVFVGSGVALIFEIGYAYTWLKVGDLNAVVTFGQPTFRIGFARAF
jgi:hypothetical protein